MFSKSGTKLLENPKKLNLNEKNLTWLSKRSTHLNCNNAVILALKTCQPRKKL